MQEQDNQYSNAEQFADRIRHALVFSEATTRALKDALELLEQAAKKPPAGGRPGPGR